MIGAGFAGASVAAALTRAGVTSGLVLERELLPGSHASGRNAAMARQLEEDPVLLKLAVEGVRLLRAKAVAGCPVLRQTGGLYLVQHCFHEVLSAFKAEPNRSFVSLSARITFHIQLHQFYYRPVARPCFDFVDTSPFQFQYSVIHLGFALCALFIQTKPLSRSTGPFHPRQPQCTCLRLGTA